MDCLILFVKEVIMTVISLYSNPFATVTTASKSTQRSQRLLFELSNDGHAVYRTSSQEQSTYQKCITGSITIMCEDRYKYANCLLQFSLLISAGVIETDIFDIDSKVFIGQPIISHI